MANITQDMRYPLSLIKYTEKYGVTKAAIKYKTTGSISIVGNGALTAPLSLCGNSLDALTTTQNIILLMTAYQDRHNVCSLCSLNAAYHRPHWL